MKPLSKNFALPIVNILLLVLVLCLIREIKEYGNLVEEGLWYLEENKITMFQYVEAKKMDLTELKLLIEVLDLDNSLLVQFRDESIRKHKISESLDYDSLEDCSSKYDYLCDLHHFVAKLDSQYVNNSSFPIVYIPEVNKETEEVPSLMMASTKVDTLYIDHQRFLLTNTPYTQSTINEIDATSNVSLITGNIRRKISLGKLIRQNSLLNEVHF